MAKKKKKKTTKEENIIEKDIKDEFVDEKFEEEIINNTNEERNNEVISIKQDEEINEKIDDTNDVDNITKEEKLKEKNDESFIDDKTSKKKSTYSHPFTNFIILLTMISALGYFYFNITDKTASINSLISCSLIVLFSIIYLVVCLTTKKKSKFSILISSLLLFGFFVYNTNASLNIIKTPISMEDFRGKSLTDVVKWANSNKIDIIQDYEYSDMIPEYTIISQDITPGSSLKDTDSITVSVSEGPNPSKEIVVPSMIDWDDERVINYVKNNYLNNVKVEFIESDKKKDTVIEQNKVGNLKRDEELNLKFSYGDEGNSDEVKLIDFTNKSKFEIEFYMKQHHLKYKFEEDFSSKVIKGFGISQNIKPGENVKVDDKEIVVTVSKGPKIKIPELKNMSISKLTEWVVKNKIKIEITDKYDDSVKEGNIISSDKEKGDVVEQGSTIKVTVSKGKLKMPSFKSIDEFYEWADKYEIKYEIKREFSDTVKSGEVISYSVKKGQTIKMDEAIIVTVSDGKNCKVPDLKGLNKNDAISKLKKADLDYNFVYKNSDKDKDKVISQSISSGSEISCGTTITVTLSNGKKEDSTVNKREKSNDSKSSSSNNNNNNSSNSSNNNSNNNGGNSNNNTNTNTNPSPEPAPEPTCNSCTIIPSELKNVISQSVNNNGGYQGTANAVISFIESKCPGINVQVRGDTTSGKTAGMVVPGSWSGGETNSCSTVNIILAKEKY